jgi:hypothetical protein
LHKRNQPLVAGGIATIVEVEEIERGREATFKVGRPVRDNVLNDAVEKGQKDALEYFDRVAEGGDFDV